ncbi:MAG: radical SAM family heme chaperone HemW [Deltaproteobacteria bacterium]|nr:radical SAM family heme chaperone HemW [Deltaproteobacteria bacterium]
MDPLKTSGLYIHIPFCLSKCPYCDFYSSTSISAAPDFLNGLSKEMEMYRHQFNPIDTVYIGGGTPSLLSPEQLENILTKVRKNFDLISDAEITIEANPADLNQSFLESVREIGINRINIGVQSFDEKALGFLGRRHSVKEAISAVEAPRKAGFENIGLDLIYGVPGQGIGVWLNTLKQGIAFSPEHLSCYQLTLEPKTPLGRRWQAGEFSAPGEELQYEFFMKTSEFLEEAGYIHYEVSNFARGMEHASKHNQKYWDHSPFLGLGPSAHSFHGNQRWWNHRSLDEYLVTINRGNFPIQGTEALTLEQLRLEAIYLSLRTKRGVYLEDFKNQYAYDLFTEKKELLAKLEEEGFISIRDGFLYPTQTGLAIADSLSLI